GPYSWWGPTPYARSRVTSYAVGTLVVDMFDARTKRAIWSGMAEDVVPDTVAERNADIDNAIAKMFMDFPPNLTPARAAGPPTFPSPRKRGEGAPKGRMRGAVEAATQP